MLKDPEINTINITTPTYRHASMTLAAAQAGKNILCEKPFCLTLNEGEAANLEAEKRDVSLMVGESYIFMSSIIKAHELIAAGEIGKPKQIRQRFSTRIEHSGVISDRQGAQDQGWRLDSQRAGGNGFPWMFDHCVHFFATAEFLMNDYHINEVYSITADYCQSNWYQSRELDIPIMTWKYEDPACQGVWMRAEPHNGKYDSMTGFSAIVIGENGMIEVLGEGGGGLQWLGKDVHLILHRKGRESLTFRFDEGGDEVWESEISYYSQAHINQIHNFIETLVKGDRLKYCGKDGIRAIRTTMAAICSAKEGMPVKVEEVNDNRINK
jgi:predicted dehydrogenase